MNAMCKRDQAVVADALEAAGQHMLHQPGDEHRPRHGDGALATLLVGPHAQQHRALLDPHQPLVANGGKDRVVMLPQILVAPMSAQQADIETPHALDRKYPRVGGPLVAIMAA